MSPSRYPIQLLPLLVFETLWKLIWLAAVGVPALMAGDMDAEMSRLFFMGMLVVISSPSLLGTTSGSGTCVRLEIRGASSLGSVRGFGLAPVPSGALDRRFVRCLGAPYARFPFREIDALDEQPQREGQLGDEARDKEHDVREVRRD